MRGGRERDRSHRQVAKTYREEAMPYAENAHLAPLTWR